MEDSLLEHSLKQIFDLLASAGYVDATRPDNSAAEKLAGGISWCIAALNASVSPSDLNISRGSIINDVEYIEKALRLVGCPHPLQPLHIHHPDAEFIFPVVQWLVDHMRLKQEDGDNEVSRFEIPGQEDEHTHQQHKGDSKKAENSSMLSGNLDELKQRKMNVVNELDVLRERIKSKGADTAIQNLITLMKSLKDLERQENDFQSNRDAKNSEIQAEIRELERKIVNGCNSKSILDGPHHSLSESLEKLHSAKKELAAGLKAVVALKRQIDDQPCQSEIIQYEQRLSELYAHIQVKHRQTRKCYATYNALLEIKELMLKETSLLNSIISQFQEAFSSRDGRTKLINSMEGIVKSSQQKLEKVQLGLQEEERTLNDLKERYAAAAGSQKHCYSVMKAFQEQCAKFKNERHQCQSSNSK